MLLEKSEDLFPSITNKSLVTLIASDQMLIPESITVIKG